MKHPSAKLAENDNFAFSGVGCGGVRWGEFFSGGGDKVTLVPVWGKVACLAPTFGIWSVQGASQKSQRLTR